MLDKLIINADDFGLNESCTNAICDALSKGLVSDTTLVANGDAYQKAVEQIRQFRFENKVGVHFNLTEGFPLTEGIADIQNFVKNDRFHGMVNRYKLLNKTERKAVYEELSAQIERIEKSGIRVTHADSHHHIHTAISITPIFVRVCREHGINKIRIHRNIGNMSAIKRVLKKIYNSFFRINGFLTLDYFGSMDDAEQIGIFDNMEIMVHPDYNQFGDLVDSIDVVDGYAVGKELMLPKGNYQLRGYRDL